MYLGECKPSLTDNQKRKGTKNDCDCNETTRTPSEGEIRRDLRQSLFISDEELARIEDEIALGIPVDVSWKKEELERRKTESLQRKNEFQELDKKYGRLNKDDSSKLSLTAEVEKAKREFYLERANIMKLRECQDFKELNSFVYKAKSQAIGKLQHQEMEIKKRDAENLLEKVIDERHASLDEDMKKENKRIAEKAYWDKIHLQSLHAMISEKEKERELMRLRNQQAAIIRNNHTAYRLQKRLDELTDKSKTNAMERRLQQDVHQNTYNMQAIQRTEDYITNKREEKFLEDKANYMEQFKKEKDASSKNREKLFSKLFEDEAKRQKEEMLREEMNYIRGRDLVDKKWRMEAEEKEKKRLIEKKQLWEDQQKTKEDILDHMCVANERDRQDFNRIVRENQEYEAQERAVEMEKKKKKDILRKDLLCKIYENIARKREEWRRTWENANNQILNNKLYLKYHDKEMYKELNRLRSEGLEEKYILEIMRQFNISSHPNMKQGLL